MLPSQITDITAQCAPRWTDARDQMIHACALQEHIIATAPVLPTSVQVNVRFTLAQGYQPSDDEVDVAIHLHQNADAVHAFREFLGGEISEDMRKNAAGHDAVHVELKGRLFGCSFKVWTLADLTVTAVAA